MSILQLPEGWKEMTLGEVIDFIVDNRGRNPEYYVESGIPVIDNVLIKDSRKIDLEESRRFIDENIYKNFIRKYNETGDVIITLVGNGYGNIALFPKEKSVIIQNTIGLRTNQESLNLFLYYLLRHDKKKILDLNIGAAQPSIKVGDLLGISISLPPLPEQVAIAGVLSSLDDKIELLREQNKTLETLGQTIFQEWFGRYSVDEPENLPDGWRVGKLSSLGGEIIRGFTTNYVEKSDVINLNQKVNKGNYLDKQYFKYYPNDTIVPKNKFVKQYDILVNSLGEGTLGRIHLYNEITENIVIDQHISILRFERGLSFYVYQYLSSPTGQFRLMNEISGSTGMLMLNINIIRNLKIVIPSDVLLKKYEIVVLPILEKIEINNSQIQSLSASRDVLLPKLMSGELRVEF